MFLEHPEMPEANDAITHQVLDGRVYKLRRMTSSEFVRFMQKIKLVKGKMLTKCWQWTGVTHREYGIFCTQQVNVWTHRLSYTHFKGEIPKGHVIDHRCENRGCCNPDHLGSATLSQNNLRSFWRKADTVNLRLPYCWKEEKVFYQKGDHHIQRLE